MSLQVEISPSVSAVDPERWDALGSPDDPFTTWAFLSALEESGSLGREAGWISTPALVWQGAELVAAAPSGLKVHSYGEYIFDWAWADAAARSGLPYYPKVVVAVPYTPATGPRLLLGRAEGVEREQRCRALLAGLAELRSQSRSHSLHVLFHTEEEGALLESLPGRISRTTQQLHWENPGLGDFEAWLGTFRHKERKEARRERRRPAELGVVVQEHSGAELGPEEWAALEGFYRDTVGRKGGEAYLSPEFFQIAALRLAPLCRALLARAEGRYVAGALFFQRGRHLYGRYWGCLPGYESLHFELCYHRPIERCLSEGWTRFEAGAQGEHKLKRGLMPAPIRSSHWLAHPGLSAAVQQATLREGQAMERQMSLLAAHGPFRRGEDT